MMWAPLPPGQWPTMLCWPNFGAAPGAHGGLNQPPGRAVAGQLDIIYGITKGGMRCLAPNCNKPLDPWSICPRDDLPFFEHLVGFIAFAHRRVPETRGKTLEQIISDLNA